MKLLLTLISLTLFVALSSFAENKEKIKNKFSINTGSFVYHVHNPNDTEYTELFDNKFFSVNVKISNSTEIVFGSLLNSYNNRCALLGLKKNWYDFNHKFSFNGLYAYSGEFFLQTFDKCNDQGIYNISEEYTGIGFAPYIYHGVEYDITSILSLNAGLIIPGIAAASVKWRF